MRSMVRRVLTTSLLSAGLVGMSVGAAGAHSSYEVQPGDTLAAIAERLDGVDSWQALHAANERAVPDPALIIPGQQLALPDSDVAEPHEGGPSPSQDPAPEPESTTTGGVWDRLAECESNQNWSANSGNGYYGGLQFTLGSWEAVGGTGYPHEASREEQIARAEQLQEIQGWGAWPSCSQQLGLR